MAHHPSLRRDRNHPSVVIWSMCNEFECEQLAPLQTAKAFRDAVLELDTSRPISANNNGGAASKSIGSEFKLLVS